MPDMASRLPELDDRALLNLHENAERLSRDGSAAQRKAADSLLPAVRDEMATRSKAKIAARAKPRAKPH